MNIDRFRVNSVKIEQVFPRFPLVVLSNASDAAMPESPSVPNIQYIYTISQHYTTSEFPPLRN